MSNAKLLDLVNFLQEIPFFSEVDKVSLLQLCKESDEQLFGKDNRIIEKGEVGDGMYAILKGKVKVHDRNHLFGTLGQGECFGEYALLDSNPRSVSVTALEDTKVLKITSSHFRQLIETEKGFVSGILSVLIKRNRELDITQEKLAVSKKEIELSHAKMSGLIDGAMDAILMFDANYRVILANGSAKKMLENEDVMQRNVLYFFDEAGSELIESLIQEKGDKSRMSLYLPKPIKVIGSKGKQTLNEGTLGSYGSGDDSFYTIILRSIDDRIKAEHKISSLQHKTEYLQEELNDLTNDHGIIAQHKSMQKLLGLIEQVAHTAATVLIYGETGTGKELVARAIHNASNRSDAPLIRVNCGAIPANLIESELFGHEKGAFTGATSSRKGRFLMADKGTIFLDEIGELPLDLQPKLLRVIQEGEFDPVGSSKTQKVDVRIVAATHRNLLELSKEGKFREDLYYRLNVFPISVPALRDRGNDVCLIAETMVEHFSKKMNKAINKLTATQKKQLLQYRWPGNVRELQNLVERAVIVSQDGNIDWEHIIPNSQIGSQGSVEVETEHILTSEELNQLERNNILKALKKTKWKISGENGAAKLLGLPATTLTSKIKAFGIERPM
ncbi:sigma 54-interacting transcriptional regulator [Flagellimonas lutimaris]|uniref:sigma 54-interacting transcriptional regulator n=1 Tax=Flagellimonas lutimaris TaxID=475082 RepID=UPI003F5CE29C